MEINRGRHKEQSEMNEIDDEDIFRLDGEVIIAGDIMENGSKIKINVDWESINNELISYIEKDKIVNWDLSSKDLETIKCSIRSFFVKKNKEDQWNG